MTDGRPQALEASREEYLVSAAHGIMRRLVPVWLRRQRVLARREANLTWMRTHALRAARRGDETGPRILRGEVHVVVPLAPETELAASLRVVDRVRVCACAFLCRRVEQRVAVETQVGTFVVSSAAGPVLVEPSAFVNIAATSETVAVRAGDRVELVGRIETQASRSATSAGGYRAGATSWVLVGSEDEAAWIVG
jgi:hypothetical protein